MEPRRSVSAAAAANNTAGRPPAGGSVPSGPVAKGQTRSSGHNRVTSARGHFDDNAQADRLCRRSIIICGTTRAWQQGFTWRKGGACPLDKAQEQGLEGALTQLHRQCLQCHDRMPLHLRNTCSQTRSSWHAACHTASLCRQRSHRPASYMLEVGIADDPGSEMGRDSTELTLWTESLQPCLTHIQSRQQEAECRFSVAKSGARLQLGQHRGCHGQELCCGPGRSALHHV